MSGSNHRLSSSPLAIVKSYVCISQESLRAVIPTRRALRPGESGFVNGKTTKQSWIQWASQIIMRRGSDARTIEEVTLFPGWASRHRVHEHEHESAFDLHVSVNGYATVRRPPEFLTRSQRAFLGLAKVYASLAKLPRQESLPRGTTMIEIDGLKLPPPPSEIADNFEMKLNKEFEHMRQLEAVQSAEGDPGSLSSSPQYDTPLEAVQSAEGDSGPLSLSLQCDTPQLQKRHENLEARLRPFWSSVLSSRTVQICIFAKPHAQERSHWKHDAHGYDPLLVEHVVTGPDGAFAKTFSIPWLELSKHPLGRHQPFNGSDIEHELLVAAKLLPAPAPTPAYVTPAGIPKDITLVVPITSSRIRVITDIDDTIKHSDITSGARTVFQNVFVKDLEETQIPEMGSWYKSMWKRGVRFHYVSNSPFELLSVIKEFLQISDLPPGSIRLKSYSGRSFISNLLSDPAMRKRANVLEVLDGFPDSKFILIGDSGERDLELYASIAKEYPERILAVFIRDVHSAGLADPTGSLPSPPNPRTRKAPTKKMSLQPKSTPGHPFIFRTISDSDLTTDPESDIDMKTKFTSVLTTSPQSFSSFDVSTPRPDSTPIQRMSIDSLNSTGSNSSSLTRTLRRATGQTVTSMTEAEKKRLELQTRVNRARLMMGPHIVLRVFNHPQECTEINRLLEPLKDKPKT